MDQMKQITGDNDSIITTTTKGAYESGAIAIFGIIKGIPVIDFQPSFMPHPEIEEIPRGRTVIPMDKHMPPSPYPPHCLL